MAYAQCFLWFDAETTQLPDGIDFSDVHIIEVAALLTDFDLVKYAGYHDPVQITAEGVESLRKNEYVLNMHKQNGLLDDLKNGKGVPLQEAEQNIIQMIKDKTSFEKGEVMLAGSGVDHFDFDLIKVKMPELASWLAYYVGDIGGVRRMTKILSGGRNFWNPVTASFQNGTKSHRAWDDVCAHLEEAQKMQEWLRGIPA